MSLEKTREAKLSIFKSFIYRIISSFNSFDDEMISEKIARLFHLNEFFIILLILSGTLMVHVFAIFTVDFPNKPLSMSFSGVILSDVISVIAIAGIKYLRRDYINITESLTFKDAYRRNQMKKKIFCNPFRKIIIICFIAWFFVNILLLLPNNLKKNPNILLNPNIFDNGRYGYVLGIIYTLFSTLNYFIVIPDLVSIVVLAFINPIRLTDKVKLNPLIQTMGVKHLSIFSLKITGMIFFILAVFTFSFSFIVILNPGDYRMTLSHYMIILWVILGWVITILSFVLPHWSLHSQMKLKKEKRIETLRQRLNKIGVIDLDFSDNNGIRVLAIYTLYKDSLSLSEWPFDNTIVKKFVFASTTPLLGIIWSNIILPILLNTS